MCNSVFPNKRNHHHHQLVVVSCRLQTKQAAVALYAGDDIRTETVTKSLLYKMTLDPVPIIPKRDLLCLVSENEGAVV